MSRKTFKLEDLADFINGYAFKPSDWSQSGIPIIRIAQLTGTQPLVDFYNGPDLPEKYYIKQDDVLFPWSGTIMLTKFKYKQGLLNQHIFKVEPKPIVDKDYLFYLLDKGIEILKNKSHGMGMIHIKGSDLKDIEFEIPESLGEQKRIAQILTCVDKNIDITEQEIKKVEHVKSGLMASFFNLLPDKIKIKEFAQKSYSGGTPSRSNKSYFTGNIPWITSGNVNSKKYVKFVDEFITEQAVKESSAKIIPRNCVLVAMYGATAGKVAINTFDLATTNQAVLSIIVNEDINNLEYLYYCLLHLYSSLFNSTQGSGLTNLSKDILDNIEIPYVSLNEQKKISNILKVTDDKIELLEQKRTSLINIKKGLLNELL